MEQNSNSLLGKAVRSRRALRSVGEALLQDERAPHQDAIDLRSQGSAAAQDNFTQNPKAYVYDKPRFSGDGGSDAWVPLIDPRNLFTAVLNAKKLIALMSLVGLVLGVLFALSMPKYYYSTAEILIDPRDLQISDRELLPTGLPYDASLALVENQTRLLTSRRVIVGTIEKLSLEQDAEFNGKGLGTPGPISIVRDIVFGRDSDDPAKAKEIAVENLYEAVGVSRAPKTFVISLSVRSQNPEKAALIANTMAAVYMDVQDEIQSDTVGRANGELGGRLEELRSDVEKAERLVEAYRSENELFDANGKLISDDEISLSSTQLTRAREKVAELRARADSARELTLDAVLSDALPEGASSNLIAELRRGYSLKVQQRDALAEKLGAQHPQLRTAEAEVTSAQRGIETELRRLSQTAQIELQRAIKTEQDLAARQAQLKSKKTSISENLVRLRELEREAAARRSVYESFLLRARETGQQAGISTANTTIVSEAVPALRPYGTSRKIIAAGGLVGGFMLGVMLALMGALWRSLTIVEPANKVASYEDGPHDELSQEQTPPLSPTPPPGGKRQAVETPAMPEPSNSNTNSDIHRNAKQGDPMYYPYPVPQHGMMMAQQPMMQQPVMQQPVVPQQMMQQPMMPQPMMQQMAPSFPYGQPMMQPVMPQPIMPQMAQQYPYGYPQMMQQPIMQHPVMQPMMQQPVLQPVFIAMPQQSSPVYQPMPSYQQAPVPQPVQQTAPSQTDAQYSEIRDRLEALRNGIVNLADGRERLSKLG